MTAAFDPGFSVIADLILCGIEAGIASDKLATARVRISTFRRLPLGSRSTTSLKAAYVRLATTCGSPHSLSRQAMTGIYGLIALIGI
jgi:hypothetical protein